MREETQSTGAVIAFVILLFLEFSEFLEVGSHGTGRHLSAWFGDLALEMIGQSPKSPTMIKLPNPGLNPTVIVTPSRA